MPPTRDHLLPFYRAAALLAAALLPLVITSPASAQTSGAENVTATVAFPSVNVTQEPEVQIVSAKVDYNGPTRFIVVGLVCVSLGSTCPPVNVTVYPGDPGAVEPVAESTVLFPGSCPLGCRVDVPLAVGATSEPPPEKWIVVATYKLSNGAGRSLQVVVAPPPPEAPLGGGGSLQALPALMAAALALGLSVRGTLHYSGLGMVAASILVYLGGVAGLWSPDPRMVVGLLIVGAVTLWLTRR